MVHVSGIKQSEFRGCNLDIPTRRELYGVTQPGFVQECGDDRTSQSRIRAVLQLDCIVQDKGHVDRMPAALIECIVQFIFDRHGEVAQELS